jgi:tetraacyldisaccharide 4'-kinase
MCAVLTCSNRYKACQHAIKELGVTKIILDDGFQHRKLHRDIDLVLVDSEKMFGNENVLPAGPLREKPNFNRVDKLLIISKNINHSKAEKLARIMEKKQKVNTILAKVEPDYVYNIISGEHLEKGCEITALSAIGQPEQFYQFLENDYKIKEKISFDDHHQYTLKDIENIEGNIITTEKDAVKLALLGQTNIYALKLKTSFDIEKIVL